MKENTKRLLDAMDYVRTTASGFDQSMAALKLLLPLTLQEDPTFNTFLATFREDLLQNLPIEVAKVYEAHFTDDEINELVLYFESSISKKHQAITPEIMQVAQRLVKEVTQSVDAKMATFARGESN